MLSVEFIRQNLDEVKRAIRLKGVALDIDQLLAKCQEKNRLLVEVDTLRAEKNRLNAELGKIGKDAEKRVRLIEDGKGIKAKIGTLDERLATVQGELDALIIRVPNILSPDTPEGQSENDNIEVLRAGTIPTFDFTPRDHIQIGEELDILDLRRGVKTGGYRAYYVKNEGVSLMLGFLMYAINKMATKGYAPMIVPTLVKEFVLFGTGYFKGRQYDQEIDEIYQAVSSDTATENKFLVGTAEPSLLAYHCDEILDEDVLPLKICGFSQCYRSEIGSHGKDTKGIYRVHEFMKVEQVVIMRADVEESARIQDEMVAISREMHAELGIPYRQLQICAGDMGLGKYRMFDMEAWMPGLNRWGETGSASNFLDWQARRLNVRYKTREGEKKFVFMLNNTALPSPRIFIAILENNQQPDGSVVVPEAIKPFMPVKFDVIRRK